MSKYVPLDSEGEDVCNDVSAGRDDPNLERNHIQDLKNQRRCEEHNKELEFYCSTDKSAICSRCFLHSHKDHDVTEWEDTDSVNALSTLCKVTKKEVLGVPPPGPIQFPSVQPNSVTLRWSPAEGASGAHRYRVSWRRGQDSRSIEVAGPEFEVGGLLPAKEYNFTVVTLGEDGSQSTCVERSVQTEVPVPKNLTIKPGSTHVSITWEKPDGLEEKVSYLLQLFKKEEQVKSILTDDLDFNTSGLQHGSEYTVQISTTLPSDRQSKPTCYHFRTEMPLCVSPSSAILRSPGSNTSVAIKTGSKERKAIYSHFKIDSLPIKELMKQCKVKPGNPKCYLLQTKRTVINQDSVARGFHFGKREDDKPTKTILLLGETGAGKTTLINTMVNYMLGVKWEDGVWFEIPEEGQRNQIFSQTSVITVHELETRSLCLRAIDTPGYGATEGVQFDQQIKEDLQTLFQGESDIHEIDVVGLVIKASQNRLTAFQHYIFQAILSLFDHDPEIKLVMFITHSDGLSASNIITVLNEAKVPCAIDSNSKKPLQFKFNNRQHEGYGEEEDLYKTFWNLGKENLKHFFSILENDITKGVPGKRKRLVSRINNLKNAIVMTDLKQEELQQIQEGLEKNDETFKVKEPYKALEQFEVPWWHLSKGAMRCTKCEENCHHPNCWLVKDLSKCNAIEKGRCTVCTNKCPDSVHVKDLQIYVPHTKVVERKAVDFKDCDIEIKLSNTKVEADKLLEEAWQYIEELRKRFLWKSAFSDIDFEFFENKRKVTND